MIAKVEKTPEEKVQALQDAIEALPEDKRSEFGQIVSEGEKDPVKAQTQFEAFMATLPPSMQAQLQNGLIDVANLTPEQLRGLAMQGSIDGEIANLSLATRGTAAANNDWQRVVSSDHSQGVDHPEQVVVTPGPSNLPNKGPGKGGQELN